MPEAPPTTIVVPLYGDLPTAERCLRSVVETVDLGRHRLLVVNDCGPEVEAMERMAQGVLDGVAGARYVRNPRNLGFVGTCNRAALELDQTDDDILLLNSDAALTPGALEELSAVLHLHEKHGVATARSNHATIATIPVRPIDGVEASPERSRAVFDGVSAELPRYTIVPVAHGFCFLVRRTLIRNYGLFDEAFAPGYGEENDFCLRVNAYGFSSVMANRAYVAHEGERSFASLERQRIQDEHEALLVARYPFYPAAVVHYLDAGMDVVDRFADLLVPADRPPKVLIDLHHMSLIHNGSTRNALSFLEFLRRRRDEGALDGLDVVVGSSVEAIAFFDLRRFGFRVVANADLEEMFDIGYSCAPITAEAQIRRLDRLCLRWVASHLDVIALRSLHLLEYEYGRQRVVYDSLRFADRVIAISQATADDTLALFPDLPADAVERMVVIHEGAALESLKSRSDDASADTSLSVEQRAVIDAGGYVLVIGNTFKHKQMREAVEALRGGDRPLVVFGGDPHIDDTGIVPITGGYLTDAEVGTVYERAAVVVYPSAYEGFGLPIAEAAVHATPVVLFDTEVAREVVGVLDIADRVGYFTEFRDLPDAVERTLRDASTERFVAVRTIDEFNDGILDVIRTVVAEPASIPRLRERAAYFAAVYDYNRNALSFYKRSVSRRSVRAVIAVSDRLQFLRPAVARTARLLRRGRPRG